MKQVVLDIVMLSAFGKQDGGRETWLYNFLPELLLDSKISKVHLFGFRTKDQEDNTELLKRLDPHEKGRVIPIILVSEPTRFPKFVTMFKMLRRFSGSLEYKSPTHVMAVGGMLETLMIRFVSRFKKATRIVWLRSIFTQEKAYRIPSFGMRTVRYLEKKNLTKTADIIIVNGDDTKNYYSKYNLSIHTIKNAIDVKKWNMAPMEPSTVLQVAYIGRLSEVKGIEAFFDMAKTIKTSSLASNYVFHVVGDGANYHQEAKALSSEGIIKFHGPINNDELPDFLKEIHICVALTYVSEKLGGAGLSNALIEQMAAEKIIVAWDNNAFNQILNSECAYRARQYHNEDLVGILEDIYLHQEKALLKASKAKEVVQPYTIEAHVSKFKSLL